MTYVEPTLFKQGTFNLVLNDGTVCYSGSFNGRATVKAIKKFNKKFELCKELDINQYNDLFN